MWGSLKLPDNGYSLDVDGTHAYIGTAFEGFIYIVDISGNVPPTTVTNYNAGYDVDNLDVENNILYVAADEEGVKILDVSTPTAPVETGEIARIYNDVVFVRVSGDRLYVIESSSSMIIYDVSTPQSPVKLGEYRGSFRGVDVNGSNAYLWGSSGLTLLDISTPATPTLSSSYDYDGFTQKTKVVNNHAYIADNEHGVKIIDVSDSSLPESIGLYGYFGRTRDMLKDGNTVYIGRERGLKILDISSPSNPSVSAVKLLDEDVGRIAKKGDHLFLFVQTAGDSRLKVCNVSTPASPALIADVDIDHYFPNVAEITGNYLYAVFYDRMIVYDISVPGSPVATSSLDHGGYVFCLAGNNAYLIENEMVKRLDISSQSSPTMQNSFPLPHGFSPRLLAVNGNYLYVRGMGSFLVYDISSPGSPVLHKAFAGSDSSVEFIIEGNYAYNRNGSGTVRVLDISNPGTPRLAGYYSEITSGNGMCAGNSYIIYSDDDYRSNKVTVFYFQKVESIPAVGVNRDSVNLAGVPGGYVSPRQEVWVNAPDNMLWRVARSNIWLNSNHYFSSGTKKMDIRASLNSISEPGSYSGSLSVYNHYSVFDFRTVSVHLEVYDPDQITEPFGQMGTPVENSSVSGSIPVTGWALDDIGVTGVKLYLDSNGTLSFIGDAVFVDGARPDVEQSYPSYPANWQAGWGYMLLTHFLPGGGNGTYKIHAIATDVEGNPVTLGTRTFICDNANAVKPFGAIDTPTQGGTASGSQYLNWGWALTPQPNKIPTDGSTTNVWVNGVNIGNPTYNIYRADIASLFPGYANSNGAVGYFQLNTTKYQNGVHTIQWTVTDSANNTDGVGSRYFTVINSGNSRNTSSQTASADKPRGMPKKLSQLSQLSQFPIDSGSPILMKKGFAKNQPFAKIHAHESGNYILEIAELETLEIVFPGLCRVYSGFMEVGDLLKPLPVGSTLDSENNKFLWSPGPGFVGEYSLVFMEEYGNGERLLKKIIIRIVPGFN